MNKDLEIIDTELKWLEKEINKPYTALTKIVLASERMAAYIEHQKKIINNLGVEITRLKAELEKYNISAFLETEYAMIFEMSDADKMDLISRLLRVNKNLANNNMELTKNIAELEKRSEVVRCGECKKQGSENCPRYHYDEVYMEHFYPEDNSYCEHGQRRESEVKDGKK